MQPRGTPCIHRLLEKIDVARGSVPAGEEGSVYHPFESPGSSFRCIYLSPGGGPFPRSGFLVMRSLSHAVTRFQADLRVTSLSLWFAFLLPWQSQSSLLDVMCFPGTDPQVMVTVAGISSNVNSPSLLPFTAVVLITWLHLTVHGSFLLGSSHFIQTSV